MSATNTQSLARFVAFVALHKADAGQRMAEAREKAGFTQQEAADAIDVDKRTLQRYEAGDIGKMATVQALADAYGLTVEEMLGGEEFAPQSTRRLSDRLDALEGAVDEIRSTLSELRSGQTEVLAELSRVRGQQEDQTSQQERGARGRAATRTQRPA